MLPRIGAPPTGHSARLANKVSAQLQQQYASKLFAIALRGSTARGTAVAGVPDLDLIVLLNHSATDIPSGGLLRGHRVKVDLAQSTYPEFMTQPKWAWMRFSLAFSGSVISGPDFISTLPDPTLKPHCIAHLKACDRWIAAWEPMFKATAQPEQKKAICQWLMKRMVRSLFAAVMVDLNCYSRDIISLCKNCSTAVCPSKGNELARSGTRHGPDRSTRRNLCRARRALSLIAPPAKPLSAFPAEPLMTYLAVPDPS